MKIANARRGFKATPSPPRRVATVVIGFAILLWVVAAGGWPDQMDVVIAGAVGGLFLLLVAIVIHRAGARVEVPSQDSEGSRDDLQR
jgi:hypothetical protein